MYRLLLLAMLLSTTMFGCSQPAQGTSADNPHNISSSDPLPETVSVADVQRLKGQNGVVVLDVREDWEYNKEHIPGVVHIPMDQTIDRKNEYIDTSVVLVTCRSGNRSGKVTRMLREQGHTNVHNMAGGIKAWKKSGYPVE